MKSNKGNYKIRFHHKHGEIKVLEVIRERTLLSVHIPTSKVVGFYGSNKMKDSAIINSVLRGIPQRTKWIKDEGIVRFFDGDKSNVGFELDEHKEDMKLTESIEVSYDNYRRKGLAYYEKICKQKHKEQ